MGPAATLSDNLRGAALMAAAMTAFAINDTGLKLLSHLPMFQVLFLRGVIVSLVLWFWVARRGGFRFRQAGADAPWLALRSLGEVFAAWFYVSAIYHMPLSNVAAIHQATPLTITLAAALFLGEPVGWRRFVAIGIGFVGVLMIVRPGTEGFNAYSLYAMGAVLSVVLRDLVTRRLRSGLPSATVAFTTGAGITLFAGAGSLAQPWAPFAPSDMAILAGVSVFVLGGYIFSIFAMRTGEVGFVSPFRYVSLIVAMLAGAIVFGERPDAMTLAGATLIVGAGLFSILRERMVGRRTRPARSPEARTPDPGTGG